MADYNSSYTGAQIDAAVGAVASKADDTAVVHDTGNETIGGVKTFSSFPVTPSSAPTTNYQVSNKKYIDDKVKTDVPVGAKFTDTVYAHPTTAGNKHIPTGGSEGQVLGYAEDGAAQWIDYGLADTISLAQKNLINILRLKLQMSLGASDIDCWSDLLADATRINAAASSGYVVSGGKLSAFALSQLVSNDAQNFGTTHGPIWGQTFTTPTSNIGVSTVKVQLKISNGGPADNIVMKIYATTGGVPSGTALYTSTNTIAGTSLTSSLSEKTFSFSGVTLSANTVYAIALERSGGASDDNYYGVGISSSSTYTGGITYRYNSGTWNAGTTDFYFIFSFSGGASVVWNAVTATEALTMMAVTADQTAGTGTIAWYLSDDGTNWTEITDLDIVQNVAFNATSTYLKCVLTGNAEVRAVAYGGY